VADQVEKLVGGFDDYEQKSTSNGKFIVEFTKNNPLTNKLHEYYIPRAQ
jgi:hypothetical protein